MAKSHAPDLILLDLHLPDIPGERVLQLLKADPGTKSIPVAVLSADATPGQVDRLLSKGARSYLTKPLDIVSVLRLLDEVCGSRPSNSQADSDEYSESLR
jgi:CheY-like chemotaxis protein